MPSPVSSRHRGDGSSAAEEGRRELPAGQAASAAPEHAADVSRATPPRVSRPVLRPEKWLVARLLRRLGDPDIRVILWDGQEITAGTGCPVASLRIQDRPTLLRLMVDPDLAFGDAYAEGRIEIEGDLLGLLETIYRAAWTARATNRSLKARLAVWLSRLKAHTISRSRRNVHHHYDIRSDFYELWLDEEMVYTCAYFSDPTLSIEEAQAAKMDYVCRKLRLQAGETVAEAGFGWGALSLWMARHYGVKVKAYNLSHEQTLYARRRAEAEGLASQVEFIEDDYRNLSGRFDVFVSVGMLEHVGRDQYRRLGEVIDRVLKPGGRGLVHSIGRNQPTPFRGWTERRIFPGAYPPSLREMLAVFEPRGFSVLDVENLRLHYARTLEHWLARYRANEDRVAEMFDERFVRMWRLYLTGSIAAFTTGTLQLFQVVFTRPDASPLPWTRAWLYEDR